MILLNNTYITYDLSIEKTASIEEDRILPQSEIILPFFACRDQWVFPHSKSATEEERAGYGRPLCPS